MIYRPAARLFLFVVLVLYALGYVFRYFFLTYYISDNAALPAEYADWHFVNQAPLNAAMLICSAVFAAFVMIYFATTRTRELPAPQYRAVPGWLIAAFVAFIGVTLVMRYTFGNVMGEAAADVSFFLGTMVYRTQSDLIPPLILLLMEIAWTRNQKTQYYLGIALLAFFFLVLSAITASKAGMINFLALTLMLMYLTGQKIWKYPVRLTLAGLAGILAFIVGSQLRGQALGIGDSAIWVALRDGHIVEVMLQVIGLIANRIPGVEGLALSCGVQCDTLPYFTMPSFFDRSPVDIYTYDIMRVQHANDYRSPGLIGGAVLLAGLGGGALLTIAAMFIGKSFAGVMDRFQFCAAAKAAFAFGMLRFMMEGMWYWADILTMLVAVSVIEFVARLMQMKPERQIVLSNA
jgi:hypothetical protein